MPCRVIPVPGGTAIVCTRGRGKKRCAYCRREHTKFCDGPGKEHGDTCDRSLCDEHAAHVDGQDLDYCREHARLKQNQPSIFEQP